MIKYSLRYLVISLCLLLAACSSMKPTRYIKKDNHYLAAKSAPPLKIPPGLSSSAFEDRYPVSDQSYPEKTKEVSIIPPGLND